jgi:hypothetical protein
MIKRSRTKAASLAPLSALPVAALVHVTGGNPSIDAQQPVVWMREIVHIQARK